MLLILGGKILRSVGLLASSDLLWKGNLLCFDCSARHLGRVVSMELVLFHVWERIQGSDPHVQAPTIWWEPLRGPREANKVLQHCTLPR